MIVLLTLLYNSTFGHLGSGINGGIHQIGAKHGRIMEEVHKTSSNFTTTSLSDHEICAQVYKHKGYPNSCAYVLAHPECTSDYFCCSLEKLSELLNMSPTVAGVTLLPFGNGAPDVFASIAAFLGGNSDSVGLNSVLGGTVFVICVVVGVVSLCVADKRVTIWGAMAFVSIYVVYALFVAVTEIMKKKGRNLPEGVTPLLPVAASFFSSFGEVEEDSVYASLLTPENPSNPPETPSKLPHWIWNTNVAIYSDYVKASFEDGPRPVWGWNDNEVANDESSSCSFSKICSFLEIPLIIPRRLTIPIVEEERWSKAYAILSAFLAPILVAFLWNTQEELAPFSGNIAYIIALFSGSLFSLFAFLYTTPDHPPQTFLFPWVFAGFFMSIIWFYIVANELVALLVALGAIFGVNPSLLG
ncbi:Cation/calcium exchanger 4 [Bienertia sinuspersici]